MTFKGYGGCINRSVVLINNSFLRLTPVFHFRVYLYSALPGGADRFAFKIQTRGGSSLTETPISLTAHFFPHIQAASLIHQQKITYSFKSTIMKSLNLTSFALILFISAITFVSCSKKKDDIAPSPFEGLWIGKYGVGNNAQTQYMEFNVSANGTFTTKANTEIDKAPGKGTWSVEGDTFKGVFTFNADPDHTLHYVGAKLNQQGDKLIGGWGLSENNYVANYTLTRQ
jgi:hypothetical protein